MSISGVQRPQGHCVQGAGEEPFGDIDCSAIGGLGKEMLAALILMPCLYVITAGKTMTTSPLS